MKKAIYLSAGLIGLGLGFLGAVLPLLPAFPFLLMAAVCFGKSSVRLHRWFLSTNLYKDNLESYVEHRGMTRRTKIRVLSVITLVMAIGFVMMSRVPAGQMLLGAVWVFHVVYFLFGMKTLPENWQSLQEAA